LLPDLPQPQRGRVLKFPRLVRMRQRIGNRSAQAGAQGFTDLLAWPAGEPGGILPGLLGLLGGNL